jgi:hypothetical protein
MRWCLLRALYYRLLFCLLQLYRFMYGRLYRLVQKAVPMIALVLAPALA